IASSPAGYGKEVIAYFNQDNSDNSYFGTISPTSGMTIDRHTTSLSAPVLPSSAKWYFNFAATTTLTDAEIGAAKALPTLSGKSITFDVSVLDPDSLPATTGS